MRMKDTFSLEARGRILAAHYVPETGEHHPLLERHNIITYQAADIMARLIGGQSDYAPKYMGFIYGPSAGTMAVPDDREHTWDTVVADISTLGGNVLLIPLSNAVSYSIDGSIDYYGGNVATFNAFANEGVARALSGGTFLDRQPDYTQGDKYFQAALISSVVAQGAVQPAHYVFARMAIDGTAGVPADETFKLAVYWSIAFR